MTAQQGVMVMGHSMKIGAAMVVVIGLVMSGMAVADAVEDPGDGERIGAQRLILEALDPLLEDGTLTPGQADAVVGELAPLLARVRYQNRTEQVVKQLSRLAAETAEVLGITPEDLTDQLESGMTLAEMAVTSGSSGDQLIQAVTDHIGAHLAVQVTAGKLDRARADEIVARTAVTLSDFVDVEHPFGTLLKERHHRAARTAAFAAAAGALGMPLDEVRAELQAGISLARIAEDRGVEEQDLIDALLSPVIARIDQAVDRGRLTEDAAAEAVKKATQRAKDVVAQTPGT
jgi:hypothetical protein